MNRKRKVFLVIIFCMGVLCGCGSRNNVYLEKIQTETSEVPQTEEKDCQEEMGSCMVYVCGAVENPGVYELPENSRVYEAVAMAGGMTEDAGMEAVNQAEFVTDGQMLRIPTMEEVAAAQEESESNVDDGLLDINRASVADFMTLPGIGQSKAEALFQYREAHGRFSSIEEIMNVDGIKEGVFNKIKDSFWALKDISFNVKKGEAVGLVGKNGCGKSTMLKTIAGVLTPTMGTVKVNGTVAPMIELGAGFDPELTARENIFLNGAILGYPQEMLKE